MDITGLLNRRGRILNWLRPTHDPNATAGYDRGDYTAVEVDDNRALLSETGPIEVPLPGGGYGVVNAHIRVTEETAASLKNGDIAEDQTGGVTRYFSITLPGKRNTISNSVAFPATQTTLAKRFEAFVTTLQHGGGAMVETIQNGDFTCEVETLQHGGGAAVETLQQGGGAEVVTVQNGSGA